VERAVIFTQTQTVQTAAMSQLPSSLLGRAPFLKFRIGMSWRELERQAIELTLAHTSGDKRAAARLLGVDPQILVRQLDFHEPQGGSQENCGQIPNTRRQACPNKIEQGNVYSRATLTPNSTASLSSFNSDLTAH
jgi:hypothetical protein